MVVVEGIGQAVADQAVLQLRVTQAQPGARLGQHVGGQTHTFLPPGQYQVGVAQRDRLRGQMHGLEAGAAQFVDRHRRDLKRQARLHGGLPGWVLAAAGGEDLAENHLVDLIRLHADVFQDRADQMSAQRVGGQGGQAALEAAYSGAGGSENGNVAHGRLECEGEERMGRAGSVRRPGCQRICWPPFIERLLPVRNPAGSLAMKPTSAAISSGRPSRPTGMPATIWLRTSSGTAITIWVAR